MLAILLASKILKNSTFCVLSTAYLEGFWFLLEDFFEIMFLHGEIFEFP
jgi:hypothetical protein